MPTVRNSTAARVAMLSDRFFRSASFRDGW
jgi:hypothetical protein